MFHIEEMKVLDTKWELDNAWDIHSQNFLSNTFMFFQVLALHVPRVIQFFAFQCLQNDEKLDW